MGCVSPVEKKVRICSESVRNVGTSSTVFAATERARRKLGIELVVNKYFAVYQCAHA